MIIFKSKLQIFKNMFLFLSENMYNSNWNALRCYTFIYNHNAVVSFKIGINQNSLTFLFNTKYI